MLATLSHERASVSRGQRLLPAATVAYCAGLLFLVEPLAAKLLLPLYGGSAAVWTGSILFFQVILLAGYCVGHLLRLLSARSRALGVAATVVLLLVPLVALPLGLPDWAAPGSHAPLPWLLLVLGAMVALPYLALAAVSPLVSSWVALDVRRHPYRLYAASNAGSLLGLLAYPFLGEPLFDLARLRDIWSWAYLGAVVLVLASAVVTRAPEAPVAETPAEVVTRRTRLVWIGLAALPVSLMLATTTELTTDVAPVPLLWVLPLALYLLTLVVAFAPGRVPAVQTVPTVSPALLALLAVAAVALRALSLPPLAQVLVDLAVLTATALALHQRLAASRPAAARLTEFYLLVGVGGAVGGLFNNVIAPLIFVKTTEYPLALLAALVLLTKPLVTAPRESGWHVVVGDTAALALPLVVVVVAATTDPHGAVALLLMAGLIVGAAWAARRHALPLAFALAGILLVTTLPLPPPVAAGRDFYGSYTVTRDGDRRVLTAGTTVHGWQYQSPQRRDVPTAYYARGGPIGQVFDTYGNDPALHVAVVGLGSGTLAAYGRPGQDFTFYELDPQVQQLARDPKLFTFLSDSHATTSVVSGDGRLTVARRPSGSAGLLVLDAFSSDAVPTHLLTTQAFDVWTRVLAPDGLIAIHITNRYLDLVPVLSAAADRFGLSGLQRVDPATNEPDASPSHWVVLARSPTRLDALRRLSGWSPLPRSPAQQWTDDYSSVVPLFRYSSGG